MEVIINKSPFAVLQKLVRTSICLGAFFLIALFWVPVAVFAGNGMHNVQQGRSKKIKVSSLLALKKALKVASPGTEIIIENGVYQMDGDVEVGVFGTPQAPIKIHAQKTGQVIFAGKGSWVLTSDAHHIILSGFCFKNALLKAPSDYRAALVVSAGTKDCRITRNRFQLTGEGIDLMVAGAAHEIDHNLFCHKNSMGQMLAVRGSGKQVATNLHIHHNYFYDFKDQGGRNGAEVLQFGLSGFSLSSSHSVVEYNLFENCHAEAELISVKASEVTLRYNTIRSSKAQFTLRHGNRNEVYNNYFEKTPGLRIYGDDHHIFGNYFKDCTVGITIGNGDGEVADGAKLTCHDRPDRIYIGFNTLINNDLGIMVQPRKQGLGATKVSVKDNIIVGGQKAVAILGELKQGVWSGNLLSNNKQVGDLPSDSYKQFTMTRPSLIKLSSNGLYLPSKHGPLFNRTMDTLPNGRVPYFYTGMRSLRPHIGDRYSHYKVTKSTGLDYLRPKNVGIYAK